MTLSDLKKSLWKYADYVSVTHKSTPNAGSPTKTIGGIQWDIVEENFQRIIEHRDQSVTVKTSIGCLRFWFNGEAAA